MTNEGVHAEVETREMRLAREYHEAVTRYKALKEVTPEAQDLIFRDRPAVTNEERVIASLDLQKAALEGEVEAFGQKGELHAAGAFEMFRQMNEAKTTILGLYFDALQESTELAEIIAEEQPWVKDVLREAANDSSYEIKNAA
jgi:hypothetical protein